MAGWERWLSNGVVRIADHPADRRTLYRQAQLGSLTLLLPGILVDTHLRSDLLVRARALALWEPDAVLTGAAAAALTFWPGLKVTTVTASLPRQRRAQPGYSFTRESLPPELLHRMGPICLTVPALTALDLVLTRDGDGIDNALRRQAATLAQMHRALEMTPHRPGNLSRRRWLHSSRAEPWAESERRLHRLLWDARITGWRANRKMRYDGQTYYLDVAFDRERLAIEVDGYAVHGTWDQFQTDRRKWSEVGAAGWLILHFTWEHVVHHPEWVLTTIRAALVRRRIDLRLAQTSRECAPTPP